MTVRPIRFCWIKSDMNVFKIDFQYSQEILNLSKWMSTLIVIDYQGRK